MHFWSKVPAIGNVDQLRDRSRTRHQSDVSACAHWAMVRVDRKLFVHDDVTTLTAARAISCSFKIPSRLVLDARFATGFQLRITFEVRRACIPFCPAVLPVFSFIYLSRGVCLFCHCRSGRICRFLFSFSHLFRKNRSGSPGPA